MKTLPPLVALVLAAAPAAAQLWQELGPAPLSGFGGATGRVSALATHPTNPNLYYAAGADGGVWKTTNSGATWTPLTDQMPTTAMGALAIDPTDGNIIYAGTGESNFANHCRYGLGLYKSTDAGNSWVQLAESTFAGRCFSKIVIDPQNTQILYASITRAGGFPELAAAKGHPGALGPRGVFKSTDGGLSWTQLAGGLPALDATDLAIDPQTPTTLYAAIGRIFGDPANGIYKTTNGGATWTKLSGGLSTSTAGRISVAVAPSNPARLYALYTAPCDASGNNGVVRSAYRSSDFGATWTAIQGVDQSTYGWYLSVISVQPTNPDVVIMGGLEVARSTNAGATWANVSAPHPDNHAMAWDAAGNLILGDDGGVHRSTNLGASWQAINTGLGTVQFYAGVSTSPANENVVLGGCQDNNTNLRTTPTRVWNSFIGGDGGWTEIDQSNPQRMFGESQGTGSLFRSTNGGGSFDAIGSGLSGRNCFNPPFLIDPANPSRMLYGTERVFVSTNGGTSWGPLSADLTGGGSAAIRALVIAPSDSHYVYAATNDGRILASSDSGATFQLRLTGISGWPRVTREITVDPFDARTVYLATARFGQPQVRRSRDVGATWEALNTGLPDVPVNVIAVDSRGPTPVIFAGTDSGLYRTVNDGQTWRLYGQGLPRACIVDIRLDMQRNRLVVGSQGRGAWAAPLVTCYADYDDDGRVTVNDYIAFLNAFAAGQPRSNCDGSTEPPILNINDFICFANAAAGGCP